MTKKLAEMIKTFLSKKVKIDGCDERAEASPEDTKFLAKILQTLIEAKWEGSYDGWYPIHPTLVNRSVFESFHYEPQPYDHGDENQYNFEDKMRIATLNLRFATEELDRVWRIHEMNVRTIKAKKAGRYCTFHGAFTDARCPRCGVPG